MKKFIPLLLLALAPCAIAGRLIDVVPKGATDRSVTIDIIEDANGTNPGNPATSIVFNTSGIDLWYRREGAAVVQITEADLATPALTDAHADGGFLHIANGSYRLDLPDAAFASGVNYVDVGGTVTGFIVMGGRVRLVDDNPEVSKPTNFEDLAIENTTGIVDSNVEKWNTVAVTAALITCDDLGIVLGCTSPVTISGTPSANDDFNLSSGPTNDNAYANGYVLCIWGGTEQGCQSINGYTASGVNVTTAAVFPFTVQDGDTVRVFRPGFATVSGAVDITAAAVDLIWDEPKAGHDTAGTFGAQANDITDLVTALTTAEPGSVPALNASIGAQISWLTAISRNKMTQTATTKTLRNDADTGDVATWAVSDDATTFTRGEAQ